MAGEYTPHLDELQRTMLLHEQTRCKGLLKVSSLIVHDEEPQEALPFYTSHPEAFIPPTVERATEIFNKDVIIAKRHDAGVQRKVVRGGKMVSETMFLGDLIAEVRGRVVAITTLTAKFK